MSVNAGSSISFKINTPSSAYHIDILRTGYYQGNGARKIVSHMLPSVSLPQSQPACISDASTGLVDCGNWGVSASWTVPADAVSGVYVAHLMRDDTVSGGSQIMFVVRNDSIASDIVYQTSDTTWEAYNTYGGNSLYVGNPVGRAYKVSYNRPFDNANGTGHDFYFDAEYLLVRFMESNGYDVTYISGGDVDRSASILLNHKIFVASGHDEYWSGGQRAHVEAARDAGVNLAFFSGNEVFWKTRWEPSIDGTSTAYRTLVSYKDTHANAIIDPSGTWTGSWRDPRFSPPEDGGRPENALTGQFFIANSGTYDMQVPSQYSSLRFWRNTAVAHLAAGQSVTLAPGVGVLGYEWDEDADNGFRPTGLIDMSSTTASAQVFTDYGNATQNSVNKTHHLTLYKAPSGALVFGAGTVQWAWGLDSLNPPRKAPDVNMQQATINLFADMHAQPATPIGGSGAATASTDTTAPTSTITGPASGSSFADGTVVTIHGTATDTGGGVVGGVEVSTDGGTTWHPTTGTSNWTYQWTAHGSPSTVIRTRASDDSANVESPRVGTTVNVTCPCSIWGPGTVPTNPDSNDARATELGVRFRSDAAGSIRSVRFYKAPTNTGTHTANLWTESGQLLGTATFTNESASGWQQADFPTPIAIAANTNYVAGYHAPSGHYSEAEGYFYGPPAQPDFRAPIDSPPLHALHNTTALPNGLYKYSSTPTFPTNTFNAENYWVDVVYSGGTTVQVPGSPGNVVATAGNALANVSWSAPTSGGAPTSYTVTPYVGSVAQTAKTVTGSPPPTSTVVSGLTNGTTYTFRVVAKNSSGSSAPSAPSNAVTPVIPTAPAPITVEKTVSVNGRGTVSAPAFSTTAGGDLIVAFVSGDGPPPLRATVSGAGLTWAVDVRSNGRGGTSEVWHASAAGPLTNAVVKASTSSGLDLSLTVVAFEGAAGIGKRVAAGKASGPPTAPLVTTGPGSRVYAAGNDPDRAVAHVVGTGQTLVHQWLDAPETDTFWTQARTGVTGPTGSSVTINDTAPVSDKWNLAVVEIRAKLAQSIAFAAIADQTLAQSPITVTATASSGLTVTFSSTTPTVCTVSNRTVVFVLPGTCTIQAKQAGNSVYAAAPTVSRSFQVTLL